jgi:hypothetical protein
MVLADFASYIEAQDRAEAAYKDPDDWARKSILNVARSGYFSSDRAIQDYLDRIWRASPVAITGVDDAPYQISTTDSAAYDAEKAAETAVPAKK